MDFPFSYTQGNALIFYLALFFAYIVVVTTAHFFKSWVALQLGDSTSAECGFLSWNPADHIDFIGMVCLLTVGLGWGRHVPINPLNIHGRWRSAKIVLAHMSDSLAYIGIGILAMLGLVFLFDAHMIINASKLVMYGVPDYQRLHAIYPTYSSLHIALGFILICTMYLSIMLGAIQFVINCFYLFMQSYMTRYSLSTGLEFVFFIMPVFAMLILVGPIRFFIMYNIRLISMMITHLLSLL